MSKKNKGALTPIAIVILAIALLANAPLILKGLFFVFALTMGAILGLATVQH